MESFTDWLTSIAAQRSLEIHHNHGIRYIRGSAEPEPMAKPVVAWLFVSMASLAVVPSPIESVWWLRDKTAKQDKINEACIVTLNGVK